MPSKSTVALLFAVTVEIKTYDGLDVGAAGGTYIKLMALPLDKSRLLHLVVRLPGRHLGRFR